MDAIQDAFKEAGGNSWIDFYFQSCIFCSAIYLSCFVLSETSGLLSLFSSGLKESLALVVGEAMKVHDLLADGISSGTLQVQVG